MTEFVPLLMNLSFFFVMILPSTNKIILFSLNSAPKGN